MIFSLFTKRRQRRPLLDTSVFDEVLRQGDRQACRKLATQLLAFVDRDDTPEEERALVTPYLVRLATHPDPEVRAHAARAARDCIRLDATVAFSIIANEDAIALPFITHAACLNHKLQMAILRAGDASRRRALCARADIAPAVVAEILERADRDTVLACLENPQATLPPAHARRIYLRFREDREVIASLLRRPDLPLEVRIAHVEIESGRLREVMARSGWQTAERAATAAQDIEEQALADILADAGDAERLQAALNFLSRRGKLTASVLMRVACAGHVAVLLHALAWLGRMRPARLRTVLKPAASLGVARTALTRANLPAAAHPLALAVLLAARREGEEAARVGHRLRAFAPLVLEAIAETDQLGVTEKVEAANMLQRVADETTRELAARFVQTMLRHAA